MGIVPNHIDRSEEARPILFIRYANPSLRYKERKLYLETPGLRRWMNIWSSIIRQIPYSPVPLAI